MEMGRNQGACGGVGTRNTSNHCKAMRTHGNLLCTPPDFPLVSTSLAQQCEPKKQHLIVKEGKDLLPSASVIECGLQELLPHQDHTQSGCVNSKRDLDALGTAKTKEMSTRTVFSMDQLKCKRKGLQSEDWRKWGRG